jgi:hypothetical protein
MILEEKEKGNPKIKCCFCDKEFVGGSARIREHLHGERNALIKPCTKVPECSCSRDAKIGPRKA